MNKTLKQALYYASLGVPVYPMKPLTKIPMILGGYKSSTTDETQIKEWFSNPNVNLGIYPKDIIMIDFDEHEHADRDTGEIIKGKGRESLLAITKRFGNFPKTYFEKTPRGYHYFFSLPKDTTLSKIADQNFLAEHSFEDVDYTTGGMVVYPSVSEYGEYLQSPIETDLIGTKWTDIAPIPNWLLSLLKNENNAIESQNMRYRSMQNNGRKSKTAEYLEIIFNGVSDGEGRRYSIERLAYWLVCVGCEVELIDEILKFANSNFKPPKTITELKESANKGIRSALKNRR